MNDILMETQSLVRSFKDGDGKVLEILRELNVSFYKGQTHAITGRSGSGKSTLLHLLGGLDHPTSGSIAFEGKDIFSLGDHALSKWRNHAIGFVFQFHQLLGDFTALENVMMPGRIAGTPIEALQEKAEDLLNKVGLEDRYNHKPAQLSGGEQQRVAIARAMINHPALILADEPTGNLDEETGDQIGNLLIDVCRQQNTTLIIVTHNASLAEKMDFGLELHHGQLISKN